MLPAKVSKLYIGRNRITYNWAALYLNKHEVTSELKQSIRKCTFSKHKDIRY